MARPRKPEGEVRENVLRVRLTADERARLDRAARSQDQEVSTWAREALLKLAGKLSRKA